MTRSVNRVRRLIGVGIEIALAVFVVAMLASALQAKAGPVGQPAETGSVGLAVLPIPGTSCLRDNVNGSVLSWDNMTGAYTFNTCAGFTLSGTGVVTSQSGIILLKHKQADRNVSAGFNTGQRTGSATIYVLQAPGVWRVYRIYDTTSFGNVCSCGA